MTIYQNNYEIYQNDGILHVFTNFYKEKANFTVERANGCIRNIAPISKQMTFNDYKYNISIYMNIPLINDKTYNFRRQYKFHFLDVFNTKNTDLENYNSTE